LYNYDNKFIEQCFQNSVDLKDKINFQFETGKINFPKYNTNITNKTNLEVLSDLAYNGLHAKLTLRKERGETFSDELVDKYVARLEYELQIINDKQIVDYFLIVADVINWAKDSGIRIGISRGSAGGSLLAYATNIIELDPIQHNLLFERFINPARTALPDIDTDTEQGTRELIRKYLEDKYGKESVLGVVTFGQYKAKSALQDATRGLGLDFLSFNRRLTRRLDDQRFG
jgi:DNA polymerase-3 subunit alpha